MVIPKIVANDLTPIEDELFTVGKNFMVKHQLVAEGAEPSVPHATNLNKEVYFTYIVTATVKEKTVNVLRRVIVQFSEADKRLVVMWRDPEGSFLKNSIALSREHVVEFGGPTIAPSIAERAADGRIVYVDKKEP